MGEAVDREPMAAVQAALAARGQTLASAESLTGGALAAALSARAGASAVFRGGVVAYATEVKRHLLGVSAARVVSAECAEQLALGARRTLGADWAVATTGVAGPDLQEGQPVGTVYVAVAGPGPDGEPDVHSRLVRLDGDRARIRAGAVAAALELLAQRVGD